MRCRVRAAASLFWGGGRRLGSYHSQRLLGAKGAEKCHPKNSDGSAAIDVLNVSFWVYSSVLVLFGIYVVAVVPAVLLCVTRSESVQVPVPAPVRAIRERNPMGHVGDGEDGPSTAAGASDKSLPSTPQAPGGPAVTTVYSGSDDDHSGQKTFNTTGQSTVPAAQQAE